MRYDEVRRAGGGGSFWLRWRLVMARLRFTRAQAPATRVLQLNEHLLRDIGVSPPRSPATWQDFR